MLKTRLNKLGRESIRGLLESGVKLSPDEIVIIHEYSKKASSSIVDSNLLLMLGKKIGNITLYPLTIGAKVWIRKALGEFFVDDDVMVGLSIIYAHCYSRDPSKLIFDDSNKCKEEILNWAKVNNITDSEFEDAIDSFSKFTPKNNIMELLIDLITQIRKHPQQINLQKVLNLLDEYEFDNQSVEDTVPAIAILLKYYGNTKNYWLWEESEVVCFELIKQAIEMETGKKSNSYDPAIVAFKDLHKYIRDLKARGDLCQTI